MSVIVRKIIKVGDSMAITIPPEFNMSIGDSMVLEHDAELKTITAFKLDKK